MSIRVMNRVWEHAEYKESTLLILLALADFADDNGICWPEVPTLAAKARVSDRRAIDIIQTLDKEGAIVYQRGGGRGKRSLYGVLVGLTEEQKERVKLFHRNYFSEIKTVKPAVRKGELQRKERVNYSVNSHIDSAQQEAPNLDPIRHVDPSVDPPTPTAPQKSTNNGAGGGDEIEHLLDEYNIGAAEEISKQYQQQCPNLTAATVRQSIENLVASGLPMGTIVNRLRRHPPEPGIPYQKSKVSPKTGERVAQTVGIARPPPAPSDAVPAREAAKNMLALRNRQRGVRPDDTS